LRNILAAKIAAKPFAESNVDPEILFVALGLVELKPTTLVEAVTFPIRVNVPVPKLAAPLALNPAVAFPVSVNDPAARFATAALEFVIPLGSPFPTITTDPVEEFAIPYVLVEDPPLAFPVKFKMPVEALLTAGPEAPALRPNALPVTFIVPVPVILNPLEADPPVIFPTTAAVAGEFAENNKQVVVPAKISAVKVNVSAMVKEPPAAIGIEATAVVLMLATVDATPVPDPTPVATNITPTLFDEAPMAVHDVEPTEVIT
jgi:hypothetical protein